MSKVLLLFLVVTQILVLHVMAQDHSEAPSPVGMMMKPLEPETNKQRLNDQNKVADEKSVESSSEGEGESSTAVAVAVAVAVAPDIRRLGKHHSTDKSVAGGGVILGGLVTATFAAVFCYIRVTRKRDGDY